MKYTIIRREETVVTRLYEVIANSQSEALDILEGYKKGGKITLIAIKSDGRRITHTVFEDLQIVAGGNEIKNEKTLLYTQW